MEKVVSVNARNYVTVGLASLCIFRVASEVNP